MKFRKISNLNEGKSFLISPARYAPASNIKLSGNQLLGIYYEIEPLFNFINDYIEKNLEIDSFDDLTDDQCDMIVQKVRNRFKV